MRAARGPSGASAVMSSSTETVPSPLQSPAHGRGVGAAVPLVGVAVAVALVPPLVATGILLAEQRYGLALNALLLFGTNLAAILLAVSVILLLSGFAPERARERAGFSLLASLTTTTFAVVAMSVPLAFYTDALVKKNTIRDAVIDSVNHWSRFSPQEIFNVRLQNELIVDGSGAPAREAEPILGAFLDQALEERLANVHDRAVKSGSPMAVIIDAKSPKVKGFPRVPIAAFGGMEWPEFIWLDT